MKEKIGRREVCKSCHCRKEGCQTPIINVQDLFIFETINSLKANDLTNFYHTKN